MKKHIIICCIILLLLTSSFIGVSKQVEIKEVKSILSGPPMDSAWPMTGHDLHHTSRSPYGSPGNYLVEKWKVLLDESAHSRCSPVIAKDGTIYIASGVILDTLYAVNPNGTIKWKYKVSGHYTETLFTPALAEDGTIYVRGNREKFYAFNPNGTIKWITELEEYGRSSPAISDDGTIFVGGGKSMYAINPDGSIKWQFHSGSEIGTSPAIDNNGIVYFAADDGYLFALYPNNGTMKWKCMINDHGGNWIDPVIGDDSNIYILGGYTLRGIYPNGTKIWRVINGGSQGLSINYDGTLYCGSGNLRAYTSNGQLRWEIESIGYGRRVAIDKNKILYAISDSGDGYLKARLMQISPDGKILASCNPSTDFNYIYCYIRTHPVIAEDGTIYVGTRFHIPDPPEFEGYLHAFEVVNVENEPPELPIIDGPTTGKPGIEYTFSIVTTDPDCDNISYFIKVIEIHKWIEWTEFFSSGTPLNLTYRWEIGGEKYIRARAQDIYGGMTYWVEHKINIEKSRNKEITHSLLLSFLEQFPLLKQLLFSL